MAKLFAVPISLKEANDFVIQFHRHNGPVKGHKFSIGCSDGEQLVGVAIVGRPNARHLDDGYTLEVTRNTTNTETAPKGTASFLYAACWRAWRAMGGTRLVTYNVEGESGASLRGAGWRIVAKCRKRGPGAWGSNQGRERTYQPIYGQQKFRWEVESNVD